MACKVHYLSSAGIQHREVKGVQALADAFPINWLVYASLNAFPRNSAPIEIDVLVVMDDRIVLLELKDWNGKLTSNGDVWLVNGGKRGRSAVTLGNEKAKKIKVIIRDQIPNLAKVFVDSRVVLTASSTREHLPAPEQPYVLTLEEAKTLGDRKERNRLLGNVHLSNLRPNMFVKDFEKLFGGSSYFQPLRMSWDGYGVTDEDFYVHHGDVWREHRAQLVREERVKALLRLWRFDQLPAGLNEPATRQLLAERDTGVIAYLGEHESWMAERGILKVVGTPAEEVLTQHHQLVSVPNGWTTLRRYLERNGEDLTGEQRVDVMHGLASMVAELHRHGVAHRDIGGDSIWIGSPTSMSLTGFASAQLPDERSVSDWLDLIGTYAEPEPDWSGVAVTARERDVRSLGLVMMDLEALGGGDGSMPPGWRDVAERATAAPGDRFPDAITLADALGELRTPSGPTVDQSRLDAFETRTIPYADYLPSGPVVTGDRSARFESGTGDSRVIVKVWNGLQRGDAKRDHALLAMLEAASSLISVPLPRVASVVACGLSPVGPFLVTRYVDGTPLDVHSPSDEESLLSLLAGIVAAIEGLHARGLGHGDLHPGNIIVGPDGTPTLIDLLDVAPVGLGRVRSLGWAPTDHERRSDQQIDRFAVCSIVVAMSAGRGESSLGRIADVARTELARQVIETLEPLADAVQLERRRLLLPPVRSFRVVAPNLPALIIEGDEGHLWVKSYLNGAGLESYFIAGLSQRVIVRIRNGEVDSVDVGETRFNELGQGVRVAISLSTAAGAEHGALELAGFLRQAAPPEAPHVGPLVADEVDDDEIEEVSADEPTGDREEAPPFVAARLDVGRLWLKAAEIEEDVVLQVRLDKRLGDIGNSAVFKYEAPGPLEFEDDDTVEVRFAPGVQGHRLGLLDVPRCDDSQIAIRDLRRPIAEGEHVALIDRRDRVSKERRRRAVERITGRRGVIPDLIDLFDPEADVATSGYALDAADEALLAYNLNEGQREAFRHLLRTGPLGLLQGPPGSGKTRFIASFVHWLLTRGGARRVLVASQSHEAVNNVLEELLKTYRVQGGNAEMLRVGARGATDRIRPYQAKSLRERYRLRFENGLKTRVAHAAAAAGIARQFAHDVVEVDRRLGSLQRTLELAVKAAEGELGRDERRRSDRRLRTLNKAFFENASDLLGREVVGTQSDAAAIVEEAHAATLLAHPRSSPSDLTTTRRLLQLSHEWKDTLGSGHRNFDEFLAKTRRVVAGTCVGLGQSQIRLEDGAFDWVIVDEAARCTSGELAVPLQLGSRVVLVGDQRQLRPMIDREVLSGLREEFRGIPRSEIEQTDFERAFASSYGSLNAKVLDEQYRMAPAISDLVSEIFYAPHGVRLKPSDERVPDEAFAILTGSLATPIVWYDTKGLNGSAESDRNDGRDIWNDAEIEAVLTLLLRLSRERALVDELASRNDQAIGVICMYSEQKRRIEREWSQRPFPESFRRLVTIDTVDAYQGKENAIVILSLVRANTAYQPGHVGRENRCNVAVSRAKERLYVIGNSAMWSSPKCSSPMRRVLAHVSGLPDAAGQVRSVKEIDR